MFRVRNLERFNRSMENVRRALPKAHRDAQVELIVEGYDSVVRRSPVLTGAYRAEHAIGEGTEGVPTGTIFEAENRVGPDTVLPVPEPGGELDAPRAEDARVAVQNIEPFQNILIFNDRFYAPLIEFGGPLHEARFVYGQTAQDLETRSGQAQQIVESRLSKIP